MTEKEKNILNQKLRALVSRDFDAAGRTPVCPKCKAKMIKVKLFY